MQEWLLLLVFLGTWIGFGLWARSSRRWSIVTSAGGGFIVGCLSLIAVSSIFFPKPNEPEQTTESHSPQTVLQPAPATITSATASTTDKPEALQIKPETIVRFPKSNIACLTKDALQQTIVHGIKGEATKMSSQFLSTENPDAECIMLDPAKRYKVISSEYNDPAHPEVGILEIIGTNKRSAASGAFVLVFDTVLVEIVK